MSEHSYYTGEDGFLVVSRLNLLSRVDSDPSGRQPHLHLTDKDIISRYRGIEGQPWPDYPSKERLCITDGLTSVGQFDQVTAYYLGLPGEARCDFIYCQFRTTAPLQPSIAPAFRFCGYDYGYYLSEYNHYSVLFNEVVYGVYDALARFSVVLNDCLLLPSDEAVRELADIRNRHLLNGADVEDDEVSGPIAVYSIV